MSAADDGPGYIEIFGASQNNLKGIDVRIPLDSLTVITGVSGSGKSSLAFDTLYAEGQRRYVESLSAYARQFLERIRKPAVRDIRGLSPAIAIRQKSTSRNPRSTVATVTEIYDFLRLLYARIGTVHCRSCGQPVRKDTPDHAVDLLLERFPGRRAYILFPLDGSALDLTRDHPPGRVGAQELVDNLVKQGFHRLLRTPLGDSPPFQLPGPEPFRLEDLRRCRVLVDRVSIESDSRDRLNDSMEMAFAEGAGVAEVLVLEAEGDSRHHLRFSERFECSQCGISYRVPEPRLFSFNNPYGACPTCQGFGSTMTIDPDLVIPDPGRSLLEGAIEPISRPRYRKFQARLLEWARAHDIPVDVPWSRLPPQIRERIWKGERGFPGVEGFFAHLAGKRYKMHVRILISRYRGYARCPDCRGERLRPEARDVLVGGLRISELTALDVSAAAHFLRHLVLTPEAREVAGKLLDEVTKRLGFLEEVGLSYLTLDRVTSTLSGGEMQRIHLAASLGSSLTGTLYVLDEPSIGLHPRDQERLVRVLKHLRDLGNTIVVVEHEREIIAAADHIIDIGPGAGELGGRLVFSGSPAELEASPESLTGRYLRGELRIPVPVFRRKPLPQPLRLRGVRQHNLKNLDLEIPLGVLVCITGVSGSGKSTLVHDVLYAGMQKAKGLWKGPVGEFTALENWKQISEVILVDQTPIGRTPRSNPVTYIKAFDEIRKIFASTREARAFGLTPAHFSFNVAGGRCNACEGSGIVTVEMQFLADVELECEECRGTRFQKRVLEVTYKGLNIHEVLQLTVRESLAFFAGHSALTRRLRVLQEVGLDYLRLGQSATTLSGGEAQRIKLAAHLSHETKGRPLFIFDEPTTGLHFDDIAKLLRAFDRLLSEGAGVLVIEHNPDVIKCADWVIDLGPEGGDAGGEVVVEGTPEDVVRCDRSYTGRYLRPYLESVREMGAGQRSRGCEDTANTGCPPAPKTATASRRGARE
jgi:excinuclease ABC subunit A